MTRTPPLAAPLAGVLALVAVAAAGPAQAGPVVLGVEFEDLPVSAPGALTSLGLLNFGGSIFGATLTRPGSAFEIRDISGFGAPASFGQRTLSPFSAETSDTPFVIDFLVDADQVRVEAGDFFGDSDTATLVAYSGPGGTGVVLGVATAAYPASRSLSNGDVVTLEVTAPNMGSVVLIGGSAEFPNSLYFDNIVIVTGLEAIPAPGAAALLGIGLLGLCGALRRRGG